MTRSNVQVIGLDRRYCADCGAVISRRAEICPNCGIRQVRLPGRGGSALVSERSRIGAALLAMFLGGLGVHKFYLGKTGQGAVYLLFCWTFIPALIGFIEGIIYISMTDDAFARRYS